MFIKDVQKVYYIKDGKYFNIAHSAGDICNYEFPSVENNDSIKIYKQCLDGHIKEILIEVKI